MKMKEKQLDALNEILNIGVGKAASMLNELVDSHVTLDVPELQIVNTQEEVVNLISKFGISLYSAVKINFEGGFTGVGELLFPQSSAVKLFEVVTGEQHGTEEINTISASTITEIGNIVLSGIMAELSNILKVHMDFSVPTYKEEYIEKLLGIKESDYDIILFANIGFIIEKLKIDGNIFLIFKSKAYEALMSALKELVEEL